MRLTARGLVGLGLLLVLVWPDAHPRRSPPDLPAAASVSLAEEPRPTLHPSRPPVRAARRASAPRIRPSADLSVATASWYDDRPGSCDGRPVPAGVLWTAHAAPFGTPLPCGTRLRVWLADDPSRSVQVVVADRGPCRGWAKDPKRCTSPIWDRAHRMYRQFDLCRGAFARVAAGGTADGIIEVRWRVLS